MKHSTIAMAACLCLFVGRTARAVPVYNASSQGAGAPVNVVGSPTPIDETRTDTHPVAPASSGTGGGTFVGSSTTASGYGYLKDAAAAELSWSGTGGNGVAVGASSEFRLDDIVITAPIGTPSNTQVYYSFAFTISGSIDAAVTSSNPSLWSPGAHVLFSFNDNNVYGYGGLLGQVSVGVNNGVKGSTDSGALTGFPLGTFTTVSGDTSHDVYGDDTRGVTFAGVPLTVSFFLSTDAGVGKESANADTGDGMAYADFSKTLLFPTTGPVLKFTDAAGNPLVGWTANSANGCIVDNVYTCPEPSAPELLGVGVGALGILTRAGRSSGSRVVPKRSLRVSAPAPTTRV